MAKIDLQYDLANYTPASASPPQANFNRIEQHINQEVIERGGTVAMTAQLKLVGNPIAELDAAPKQYVDAVLPVGIVMMFGGTLPPAGGRWVLCNGAELQTTEYPALYAVIGANYTPAGTPAGRFRVPNLTDRFPMATTPGATGGNRNAVLIDHTHTLNHGHTASSGVDDRDHTHGGVDHLHGISVGTHGVNANHNHYLNMGEFFRYSGDPVDNVNTFAVRVGDGYTVTMTKVNTYVTPTGVENQDHAHHVPGSTGAADRSLTTHGRSTGHYHGITVDAVGGNTGGAGSGNGADANLPPYLGMTFIIRAS